jgi:hypothetical protein
VLATHLRSGFGTARVRYAEFFNREWTRMNSKSEGWVRVAMGIGKTSNQVKSAAMEAKDSDLGQNQRGGQV